MEQTTFIDWQELSSLAEKLSRAGTDPASVLEVEWQRIDQALNILVAEKNWQGVIRLRALFNNNFARDAVGDLDILVRLDGDAINAARWVNDKAELAHLLGAKGHNLHRQGYHQAAIETFEESARLNHELGKSFESLKSFYMTSLCYRALGNRSLAKEILAGVLEEVAQENPWRGNPLQVMAWLVQDDGQLAEAERLLHEALECQKLTSDPDILLVGTYTDIGEIVGLQGRFDEAYGYFLQSLTLLEKHKGQYSRQEARTNLKFAELIMRQGNYGEALRLLNKADDMIRSYGGYYDLMWRIELARAYIYLRQRRLRDAVGKFRAVRDFRHELGLSDRILVSQLIRRFIDGTGLPR